jgi:hypothetical protein
MTDLEQFLRRASRGLWGRERQTVRQELESHIRHRAQRYEVDGSSQNDAIKLAIADLGEAREISAGMKGVYSVPTTIRAGVLTAAFATFVFMGVQLSTAQVTGTTKVLTPACLEKQQTSFQIEKKEFPCEWGSFSINFESLKAVLKPLGVQFQVGDSSATIRWPEGAISLMDTAMVTNKIVFDVNGKYVAPPSIKGYVSSYTFFDALRDSGLPVHIDGWDNPEITVGKTKFTLGSNSEITAGSSIYPSLFSSRLDLTFWFWPKEEPLVTETAQEPFFQNNQPSRFTHTIQTKLEPGSVALVISRETSTKTTGTYNYLKHNRVFINPVQSDGSIEYPSFSRTLAIVNPRDINVGIRNGHATISLMRFSGEYSNKPTMLEPVAPESIKIISR